MSNFLFKIRLFEKNYEVYIADPVKKTGDKELFSQSFSFLANYRPFKVIFFFKMVEIKVQAISWSLKLQSKFAAFAPHMEMNNADFAPYLEGSHEDFALHKERRPSFSDLKIACPF